MDVVAAVEPVEDHHRRDRRASTGHRGQRLHRQPHPVDGAEAGVGHQHHHVGGQGGQQVGGVAVGRPAGDRTPPAISTTPTCTGSAASPSPPPGRHGERRAARAPRPPSGEPWPGDRSGTGGTPCRGPRPEAAPSTSASVGPPSRLPSESMSNDWAGLRAATDRPRSRSSRSSRLHTQVLPTSVPVPHTSTSRSGRNGRLPVASAPPVRHRAAALPTADGSTGSRAESCRPVDPGRTATWPAGRPGSGSGR